MKKKYVVLKGILEGNYVCRFYTTNSKDPEYLANGKKAYKIIGYADSSEEALKILGY